MRRISVGVVIVHTSLLLFSSVASYFGALQGETNLATLAIIVLFGSIATLALEAWRTRNRILLIGELVTTFTLATLIILFPRGPGLSLFLIHTYLILEIFVLIFADDPIYTALIVIPLLILVGIWNPIILTAIYSGSILIIERYNITLLEIMRELPAE